MIPNYYFLYYEAHLFSFFSLPILIEPVVDLGLGVEGISEVRGSGGSDPEFLLISAQDIVDQLLILSLVVFLDDSEVSEGRA
jgi:hypothetical protein